jgi:tetratricopeptide (TPR) repeat protein
MTLRMASAVFLLAAFALGDDYPVILKGKVTMQDGSPPPRSVGIQRICTDSQGSAPGPLTDKKGEYLWRMQVDPMRTRACHLEVSGNGYVSTRVDISGLKGFNDTVQTVETIVLSPAVVNPLALTNSDKDVPSKALKQWRAAMKGIDDGNIPEAISQLEAALMGSPKFALGWHTLAILQNSLAHYPQAKESWRHAIESDPKAVQPRVAYTRVLIKVHDWEGALKAAEETMKADPKRAYPELYLHLAAAKYGLKDYDGALAAMADVTKYDSGNKRAEFVMGRILEAKGDAAGAKEHIAKYVSIDPAVVDIQTIKAHLALVGQEGQPQPELELP